MYKCERCGKEFKRSSSYKIHIKTCGVDEQLECVCGRAFKNEVSLNIHQTYCDTYNESIGKEPRNNTDKEYKCKCGRKFNNLIAFTSHKKSCKFYSEEQICVCGRKFENENSFNRHKFYCKEYCDSVGVEVKTKKMVNRKRRKSTAEFGEFKCKDCGKIFDTKNGLNNHKRTHNSLFGPHICECGRLFESDHGLKIHMTMCKIYCENHEKEPRPGPTKGKPAWNKGLTIDDPTHGESIKRSIEGMQSGYKKYVKENGAWNKGKHMSEESRRKQSETRKKNIAAGKYNPHENYGRGIKGYFHIGDKIHHLRSIYELVFSLYLSLNNKEFLYEEDRFTYKYNGTEHVYIADFTVGDKIYEVKGYTDDPKLEDKKNTVINSGYEFELVGPDDIFQIRNGLSKVISINRLIKDVTEQYEKDGNYNFDFDNDTIKYLYDNDEEYDESKSRRVEKKQEKPIECPECGAKLGRHYKTCSQYKAAIRNICPECGARGTHFGNCSKVKHLLCPECGGKNGCHRKGCSKHKEIVCQECGARGNNNHKSFCSKFKRCPECDGGNNHHRKNCSKFHYDKQNSSN